VIYPFPENKRRLLLQLGVLPVWLLFFTTVIQAQTDTSIILEEKKADAYQDEENVDTEEQDKKKDYLFVSKSEYDSLLFWQRTVPDSALKRMQGEKAFWYANGNGVKGTRTTQPRRDVKNGKQVVEEVPVKEEISSPNPVLQTVMWLIIIGSFAGAIVWYLASSNVGLFRKKDKKIDSGETEEMPEDIFAINYQKEIDKAASQGNYRLAIRLMYLRLLKDFSEKNIIQYKQDRTNLDYLMQLHGTSYYNDFFLVTRHYEYSWYGEFNVSNEAYEIIKKEFSQLEKISG
jgi:hypothetical protein